MKSVKTLALAFAVGGLSATGAWADGGSVPPPTRQPCNR